MGAHEFVPDCRVHETESDSMHKEDLPVDNHSVACGRCGKYHDMSVLGLDDEEGIFLCPMCQAESISCGCSDALQVEN